MKKTNVSAMFAKDKNLESNGKWFEVGDGIEFLIRRVEGANAPRMKSIRAKYVKPKLRQIQSGTMTVEAETAIYVRVFVEGCLVDWKGITDEENNIVEYSDSVAIDLLNSTPDLFDLLSGFANEGESFKEELGKS